MAPTVTGLAFPLIHQSTIQKHRIGIKVIIFIPEFICDFAHFRSCLYNIFERRYNSFIKDYTLQPTRGPEGLSSLLSAVMFGSPIIMSLDNNKQNY